MRPRARKCLEHRPGVLRQDIQQAVIPREGGVSSTPQRTTALFDNLSERLGGILDRLTGRGSLSEADVDAAMREVRRALLEADVALDVVRRFTEQVKKNTVGVALIKSV